MRRFYLLGRMALRLLGYIRVSRVGGREGDGYVSPEIQRDSIAAYADELGGSIVRWADDQDFSGGTVERPGFQAALEAVERGEADGIVVMRIDRFARSVADGARIVRELTDAGKVFASCHERIDPSTPEGRFMLTSFLANAELFLDQAKAGWVAAKARAIARGVHIGPAPIGYLREKSKPLTVHPLYGPAICELFRRAASGRYGDSDLARWMQERAPRTAGRRWQPSEVRRWLRSRVYRGEVRYGDLINTEAHPPLVDEETWQACQREPGRRHQAPTPFLLAGLIRCARCRYSMGGNSRGGFKRDTPIYRCTGRCEQPSVITAAIVERHVMAAVRAALGELRLEAVEDGADLAALEEALTETEVELAAFASDLGARRLLGEAEWQTALAARAAARDEARAGVERARAVGAAVGVELDDLGRHRLRSLLGGMIRTVFVRRGRGEGRIKIVWSDAPPLELPGAHRSGPFDPVEW